MGRSRTESFSAGSYLCDLSDDFNDEQHDDREASWLDRQSVEHVMAMNDDTNYTNIAVLTQAALREAEATRDRERHQHTCGQHTAAPLATSTTTPPPREDQMLCSHTGESHSGRQAPLTLLSAPQTWRPALHEVLLVTRIWRDMIWVWNESERDSHHGVGIVLFRWLLGEYPHWQPAAQKHVQITGHFQDQEDSGLPVVQMNGIIPSGWPWGRGILMVRWLEGW